jgi:hypothetical protein
MSLLLRNLRKQSLLFNALVDYTKVATSNYHEKV